MADVTRLEQDAISLAQRAVKCDQAGLIDTAISYYSEAADALMAANIAGSKLPGIANKITEYLNRVHELQSSHHVASAFNQPAKSPLQLEMERAKYLLEKAFDEDGDENHEEAIELYMEAAEFCLALTKKAADQETRSKVTALAQQAIERAETLKGLNRKDKTPASQSSSVPSPVVSVPVNKAPTPSSERRQPAPQGGAYTKEEIEVLRRTSYINGREYVPFLSVDFKEKFALPLPFSDHRLLPLSAKQKAQLNRWARPDEIMPQPTMIYAVSPLAIKQSIVSDCSFVASLAIAAQYERRFNTKLITSIIYPQNRKGEPQFNPCGKYMVKLNLNGVLRKVVIDDLLPIGHQGQLLCSYSMHRNELWVSLLEKAYLKVMGGYDFPGSNSNIDLHALTGWIPERVDLQDPEEFNPDKEFNKIKSRFHKGDCLVTVGTGELSPAEEERAGLVTTHAYAMLNIVEIKGYRLFQLKNPWNVKRWKGNFSDFDTKHWTPDMEKALSYDRKTAVENDNGVFWIDYESLRKFFKILYINWNPALFSHTTCLHRTWKAKEGPKKDRYSVAKNPQFRLEVNAPGPSAVWILLTRHITDKDDFADNKEFITIVVYKNDGRKVFYPNDPEPYKDGVRINTPHYLCKMTENKGTTVYTLLVSQYEKNNTIHYTLRVYSSCPFTLRPIPDPYNPKYDLEVTGEWKGLTAGGCENNPTSYQKNPIYQMKIDNTQMTQVLVELRAPKEFNVGLAVTPVSHHVPQPESAMKKMRSGPLRRGYCVLEMNSLAGGLYNIMPYTFHAGQESAFFLNVSSSFKVSLSRLQ